MLAVWLFNTVVSCVSAKSEGGRLQLNTEDCDRAHFFLEFSLDIQFVIKASTPFLEFSLDIQFIIKASTPFLEFSLDISLSLR